MVIRYTPRDITTLWVYQYENGKDTFLTRAHAQDLETEMLSVAEAKAISRRLRRNGRLVTNQALLEEVRWRDQQAASRGAVPPPIMPEPLAPEPAPQPASQAEVQPPPDPEEDDDAIADEEIPDVEVYYYDDDLPQRGISRW